MSLSAFSAAPDIATNYIAWVYNWLNVRIENFSSNCPLERAITYYFSQSGDDDTGLGTEDRPFKTLAKAQTLQASGVRLRFKRGDTWREATGLTLANNTTADDYGDTLLTKPILDKATVRHLAANNDWINPSGNRKDTAETTDVAWVKLAAFPLTRPLQRVLDATACASTSNSWFWTANTLYINLGGDDPNDFDIDVIPSNTLSGVKTTGDGNRVQNLIAYGWGCHRTTTTTQEQPFTNTSSGNNSNLFVGCEGYYSGSHSMAHYQGSSSGGRTMWINCKGGYTKYNGAPNETVFNTYSNTGGHETWFIGCEVPYGTLPQYDWTPSTIYNRAAAFNSHTTSGVSDFQVIFNCLVDSNKTYGPHDLGGIGNPATSTWADRTTFKNFIVNCSQTKSLGPLFPTGMFARPTYGITYGCRYSLYPAWNAGIKFMDANQRISGWMINNYITVDLNEMANTESGIYNNTSNHTVHWYHNFIEVTNGEATTMPRWGIDFRIGFATNPAAGAGTSASCNFVNNIVTIKKTTGTNAYPLGFNNTTNTKNNLLHGITDVAGQERGYNLTTGTLTTASAPVLGTAHASALAAGSTELVLSHDINGKRRLAATPDIGPEDFSSVVPFTPEYQQADIPKI